MNNETKHTPGPWRTWQAPKATAQIEISTAWVPEPSVGQTPIATVDRNLNTQAWFNARLIVAAPDLLEALRECITEDGANGMQEGLGRQKRRLLAINDIARKAIAKAEGKS